LFIFTQLQVQSKIVWNSSNSKIVGFAMSSDDFASLHDVYEGLDRDESCQPTTYMMQFLWRDLSSKFDVIGPYFSLSSTVEAQYLHNIVVKTMLVFHQFGFHIRGLLCDGASSNLAVLKQFSNVKKGSDTICPWFVSPFDNERVHLIICPSHQLKNMLAALYSSRNEGGTKDLVTDGVHFGWRTIQDVYKADITRAKHGQSRRVPKLKYSYVVRDAWTRLNVLPAKIMQQPYMLAAIEELAQESFGDEKKEHLAVHAYLKACNSLFENGILSSVPVNSPSSHVLSNIEEGFQFFQNWKSEIAKADESFNYRNPIQKSFLAWQTWDLLQIMVHGFTGLCLDFLRKNPDHFVVPVRVTGSVIESLFSNLKYVSGGQLSSINYSTSLSALITQRESSSNAFSENGYRNVPINMA
jgi:hypothetical protein